MTYNNYRNRSAMDNYNSEELDEYERNRRNIVENSDNDFSEYDEDIDNNEMLYAKFGRSIKYNGDKKSGVNYLIYLFKNRGSLVSIFFLIFGIFLIFFGTKIATGYFSIDSPNISDNNNSYSDSNIPIKTTRNFVKYDEKFNPDTDPTDFKGKSYSNKDDQLDDEGLPRFLYNTWNHRPLESRHSNAIEVERAKLRNYIEATQNPSNCYKAPLCTCSAREGGLFSRIHARAVCLGLALASNCTYVDNPKRPGPTNYVDNGKCKYNNFPSRSAYDCSFLPISTCGRKEIFEINPPVPKSSSTQQCGSVKKRFRKIRQILLLENLPDEIIQSEIMSWIMRPNVIIQQNLKKWAKKLGLNSIEKFEKTLGVHIRHGDKANIPLKEKERTKFVDISRSVSRETGISIVNFMTDDATVRPQMKTLEEYEDNENLGQPKISVIEIPENEFPSFSVLNDHPDVEIDKAISKIKSKNEFDEVTMLFTQVILLSRSAYLAGSLSSNVFRTIYELNLNVHKSVSHKPAGRSFQPCVGSGWITSKLSKKMISKWNK